MDERYLYSGGRIKALESTLLSESQLERLLSAKDKKEAFKVLHDTFMAPYIGEYTKTQLPRALRKSVTQTKYMLASLAPEPDLLDFLWIKYDFYNLKTILKGQKAGLDKDALQENCYYAGKFSVEDLFRFIQEGALDTLASGVQKTYEEALNTDVIYMIDMLFDRKYFDVLRVWEGKTKNTFVQKFVSLQIDIFNLKTQFRVFALEDKLDILQDDIFIEGGTFVARDIQTQEELYNTCKKFGGEELWKEALEDFTAHKNHTMIVKILDDYRVDFLKKESYDVFSPATLFAFFRARLNNIELIKTIFVAKENNISEYNLRFMLRRLYV